VVQELNRGVAADRRTVLSLWRWEDDARSGTHVEGPQGLIDELMEIRDADLVVGVFWKRFGTPTGTASSGTEHELRRAWAACKEYGSPDVMVYFCTRAYAPTSADELAQWQRVLEFRRELPSEQLSWTYSRISEFERLLREHLTRLVLERGPPREQLRAPPAGIRVRFNVPVVAAAFTGRERELDALEDALGVADRAVVTQAITGLGGVGKSQLAARYVQQRADDYDVVAWIRAEDGGIRDLAALAGRLVASVEQLSPSERAQLALEWLGQTEQPWLLVFDNVESAAQLEGLLPRGGRGRVLVTSRDRALRQFGPVLAVDVFDEETATAFLIDRSGRAQDERAARELAAALGFLPLALSHAAAFCHSGTSFADYQRLLGELPARALFDSHPELSYAQTVASTWKASIQSAGQDAPLAADVLAMAAHLGPDAIPKSLFSVLVHDTPLARKRLVDALNALARFSLAIVDDDSVSVHRLLQKVVRDDLAERDDQTAPLRALAAVGEAFPVDGELPPLWPLCELLLPHALALVHTLVRPGDAGPQLIDLINRACRYLNRAEPGGRGLVSAQGALAHAERILGSQHPQTQTARHHLATAYQWEGRPDRAIAIFELLRVDRERGLGAEHPDTLMTLHDLAGAYTDAGRIAEAIAIFEPLLAGRQRILGARHPDTMDTGNNLAGVYRFAGRIPEAIAIFEPLRVDRERILGAEHPDTLRTGHNLAGAYKDSGRIAEAIALYEQAGADRERILGVEHPDTLRTRHNLATAYQAAGRSRDAIAIFEPLLVDYERILGGEHPHTLSTRNHLAAAYLHVRRTGDAIAIFEALLADRERILGVEHPDTLSTRQGLAGAYQDAGRSEDARRIRKQAGLAQH
jgi:tetratricopeptide (TPR) repeat protein